MSRIVVDDSNPRWWRVTFDHPPLNLIDTQTIIELRELLEAMAASDELCVVVFDSAVDDFYLAHYDIGEDVTDELPAGPTGMAPWLDVLARIAENPVVSIAAIRGRARGAGSEFVLACDLRYGATENMVLGQIEIGFNLPPGGGPMHRLPAITGRGRALEIVLTGLDYDADRAERYGYINRALPDSELGQFVDGLAHRIASFDPTALGEVKAFVNQVSLPEHSLQPAAFDAFWAAAARPAGQRAIKSALDQGFGHPGDFELNMGDRLGASSTPTAG